MIAESVAFLRAQGKRVVYDAEHFFDGYRQDRDYALRCLRAAVEAGAENVTLCDTNGSSLPGQVGEATADVVAASSARTPSVGIHTHDDTGCAVANSLVAVQQRRAPRAGHDQRLRRALRQRQPRLDPPGAPAQAGLRLRGADEQLRAAHRDRALRRRDLQRQPQPQPALRGQERVRPQGRHARGRRSCRTRARSSTSTPRRSATTRSLLISELSGKGTVQARAEQRGVELDEAARHARGRARQGARAPRLPVRGRRRLVRPADPRGDRATTSRCSGSSPGA